MKDYDNSLLALLMADEATTFWAVDLLISDDEHIRYTNLDIDVAIDGVLFAAAEFEVNPLNYSLGLTVDKMVVIFENQDLIMSSYLLNYTLANRIGIVYLGAMDGSTPIIEEMFRGPVSEWDLSETAEITISTEMVYWNKKALRLPGSNCPWTFGLTECGYTGSGTCDQTYDSCLSLGNSDNFGGSRFLASLEEKTIQWGKSST